MPLYLNKNIFKIFLIFIFVLISTTCNKEEEKIERIKKIQNNNIFELKDFQKGDEIAGFEIVDLFSIHEQKDINIRILFKGEKKLSGRYVYYSNDAFFQNNICFYPDDVSINLFPRMVYDHRNNWFCFKNPEELTKRITSSSEGLVKILIDNYEINMSSKNQVWNKARFIDFIFD